MFQFKQFAVDQSGCALKINTDGVLLGAMATTDEAKRILDIGTGTGVIALMMAQRFASAEIDAVEIDERTAITAARNFSASKFSERIKSYHIGFEEFFNKNPDNKYDLIISNPPFYINSLKSPGEERSKAKHADYSFFETLITKASKHLSANGLLWLILPVKTSLLVQDIAIANKFFVDQLIEVRSYSESESHRHIIAVSKQEKDIVKQNFVIYNSPKQYSEQYQRLLIPFFTIF